MTLTVRLDAALDAALQRHCEHRGVTKSLVVQESLAAYLLEAAPAAPEAAARREPTPSANHRAFAAAGLIGVVADGGGADKAALRRRIAERKQRKQRPLRQAKP
ncbi:MAG: hypothetical protein ABS84_02435 [Rubrivivax sp. SCN 71-131]|jgi:hypothetical protein|nr:MAG: hypothetical protein ABS84_02435 [Rubrivivax sp. SCN 71-131]